VLHDVEAIHAGSAARRFEERAQHANGSGFAGSIRAQQAENLALLNVQIDASDGNEPGRRLCLAPQRPAAAWSGREADFDSTPLSPVTGDVGPARRGNFLTSCSASTAQLFMKTSCSALAAQAFERFLLTIKIPCSAHQEPRAALLQAGGQARLFFFTELHNPAARIRSCRRLRTVG